MKTWLKNEWLQLAPIIGMLIAAGTLWNHTPDRFPVHWNMRGEVDRYGGKVEGLLAVPLVCLGLYVLFQVLPYLDPRRENYVQFARAYWWIRLATTSFLTALYGLMIAAALGGKFDMSQAVFLLVGGLFVILGNFMGKLRPNWFVGVRTPWTLSSNLSWSKTHRLAGWVFILLGVTFAVVGWHPNPRAIVVALVVSGLAVVWIILYSYLVWRSDPDRGKWSPPKAEDASQITQ